MPPRIALLSAPGCAEIDTDLPPLRAALDAAGLEAQVVDWHDGDTDWAGFDLAVVRSTWDYTSQVDDFLTRLEQVDAGTRLANPLAVVRANAEKGYLLDLARAGVPVVPTQVLRPGDAVTVPEGVAVVVKPTVSAGARDTERHEAEDHDRAAAHAATLLAEGRSVLVQPYVAAIDEVGETGLVFVGDRFSHAFRKEPILHPDFVPAFADTRESPITPRRPSDDELAVAEAALDAVGALVPGASRSDLLYARVDLVPGVDGPVVMELELIEPSWYLHVDPDAPARAAAAIAAATAGPR